MLPNALRMFPAKQHRRDHARLAEVLAGALAVVIGVLTAFCASETSLPKEQQVKAAFVFNFAKFVDWPAQRFASTNAPLTIGVLAPSTMGAALAEVIQGRNINGRPLVVQVVDTPEAARTVHVLVCTASDDGKVRQLLPTLANAGVLTVGETDLFAQTAGMIRFITEGDRVRFEVNVAAAEEAGLHVSAQLQKLAKAVKKGR